MQGLISTGSRTVNYFSLKLAVIHKVRYIALDKSGAVFGYTSAPVRTGVIWVHQRGECYLLCRLDRVPPGIDFKHSLQRV